MVTNLLKPKRKPFERDEKNYPKRAADQTGLTDPQIGLELYIDVDNILRTKKGEACTHDGVPLDSESIPVTEKIDGRCNRVLTSPEYYPGTRCRRTVKPGFTRCYMHPEQPPDFEEQFIALRDKILTSDDLYDLDTELASLKAVVQMMFQRASANPGVVNTTFLNSLGTAADYLGKVIDRIKGFEKGHTIRIADVATVTSALRTILSMYLDEAQFEASMIALRNMTPRFEPHIDYRRFLLVELPEDFEPKATKRVAKDLHRLGILPWDNFEKFEVWVEKYWAEKNPPEETETASVEPKQTVLR